MVKIEQADFEQIESRIEQIKGSAMQAQAGTDQQRIDCLDHIIAWTHEINLYKNRRIK